MTEGIIIQRASYVEPSESLTRLFSDLYGHPLVPDTQRINALIGAGSLAFYLMTRDGETIGMASVIPCRTATSDKLWIEDVCILEEYRGQGLGKNFVSLIMDDAAAYFGGGTFWLTSNPSRVYTRKLYPSLGFTEYETGVFFKNI